MNNPKRLREATAVLGALVALSPVLAQEVIVEHPPTGYTDELDTVWVDADARPPSQRFDENATAAAGGYSFPELETLVGPYALYPDDLLAIVLPAATYPLQLVEAKRFLADLDAGVEREVPAHWDDAVVALLNYPDVLALMDQDLNATWRLGDAVVHQREEVLSAVEQFRVRAYDAGNLRSDQHQLVSVEDEIITVEPVDDEVLYVPNYEPTQVLTYQRRSVVRYYPRPYPIYYYPYPASYRFSSSRFWGVSSFFSIGWGASSLFVYNPWHVTHPFYGARYASPFYRTPIVAAPVVVQPVIVGSGANRWRPGPRYGDRPRRNEQRPARDSRNEVVAPPARAISSAPRAARTVSAQRYDSDPRDLGVERFSARSEREAEVARLRSVPRTGSATSRTQRTSTATGRLASTPQAAAVARTPREVQPQRTVSQREAKPQRSPATRRDAVPQRSATVQRDASAQRTSGTQARSSSSRSASSSRSRSSNSSASSSSRSTPKATSASRSSSRAKPRSSSSSSSQAKRSASSSSSKYKQRQ